MRQLGNLGPCCASLHVRVVLIGLAQIARITLGIHAVQCVKAGGAFTGANATEVAGALRVEVGGLLKQVGHCSLSLFV